MSRTTARAATLTGLTATTVATGLLLAPAAFAAPPAAPVVTPSTVAVEEDFTVSGEGCVPESDPLNPTAVELYIEDGTELGHLEYVDPETDGKWSATLSFLEGTVPGDYVIETMCLDYLSDTPRIVYPDVTVTLKSAPASTPSTPTETETTEDSDKGWGTPTKVMPTGNVRGTEANTPGVASPDGGSATGDSAAPGRKVVKVLTGFQPGEVVTVTLHSTPQTMGTFTADANGTVTVEFTVPAGTPTGDHTLVYEGDMGTYFQESFTVAAAAATSNASSNLAYTGADVALPLGLGVGALALGGGLVFAARRRSAEGSQA
jgi:5-hydroxyisourate hydrolase-like protein (transthyretin family)